METQDTDQAKHPQITAIKLNGKNKGGSKNRHPHPQFRLCVHPRKKPRLHILVVTSDDAEATAISAILKAKHFLYIANDVVSLIQLFHKRKRFDAVIVSENFKKIGFGFFPIYFQLGLSKRLPKLIQLGGEAAVPGYAGNLSLPIIEEQLDEMLWDL